ncbi:MAG: hypothetical protein FJ146_09610 [Deltaproteobacteria bacterium]|nr:hypothetical protein [Deltaproteobacteria bacterium]
MGTLLTTLRLPLSLLGLALLFIAERYLSSETYHLALRVVAMALMALGWVFTLILANTVAKTRAPEAKGWRIASLWQLILLASSGAYLGYAKTLTGDLAPETLVGKVLLAVWLILLFVGIAGAIGSEWSMRSAGRGELAEPVRVGRATLSWTAVGILLAFLVTINYVADKKDVQRDWSYLKVSSPSQSTLNMVKTLTDDLTIALFYPQSNEVKNTIESYFKAVSKAEPKIKLQWLDKDMSPNQAEELRVNRNGIIVFDMKGKKGRIDTGTTLDKAKKTLREIDGEFQKAFLETTATKRTVYFTRGHGESTWVGDASDSPLKSLTMLEGFLRGQNYTTKFLGISEGSATAVPDDAAAVVIVGPEQPFQKEEVDSLRTYLQAGGNLMVFLDVEQSGGDAVKVGNGEQPLLGLLKEIGIDFQPVPLANDKNHVSLSHGPSDAWIIFSNVFTSHDSVTSLSRHDERVAILFYQSGYFKVTPDNGTWTVSETVRSMGDTYADVNRNFRFDTDEKRQFYPLGVAAELKTKPNDAGPGRQGRVVAIADASILGDGLVRNVGNALYFADSLKWLVGQPELQGQLASEEDVKIRLSRKQDIYWFQSTVMVVPMLVLGSGFFATRRRSEKRKTKKQEGKS